MRTGITGVCLHFSYPDSIRTGTTATGSGTGTGRARRFQLPSSWQLPGYFKFLPVRCIPGQVCFEILTRTRKRRFKFLQESRATAAALSFKFKFNLQHMCLRFYVAYGNNVYAGGDITDHWRGRQKTNEGSD
jgi:hypothetical protein